MKQSTIVMVWGVLLAGLLLTACSTEKEAKKEVRRYVKVLKLGKTDHAQEYVFNGQLKEIKEVNVAFRVGGQVLEILTNEGDYVEKGQVIARMDKRDYAIQLQGATARYNQAKGEYERYQQLYEKKKLPINTLEKLKAGYLAAESAYEAANNALTDTELKAPFSGYVYHKNIDKFENVAPGQPIITLIDVSQLEVHFSLSENQVEMASQFDRITCDVPNVNQYNIMADFLSINEKANGNDMFDVRLRIDNTRGSLLKPGMSARVHVIMPTENTDKIQVPVESVFYTADQAYVWRYETDSSTVKRQEITVEKLSRGGLINVSSGLKPDDQIVTAGVHSLSEGQAVKVITAKNS